MFCLFFILDDRLLYIAILFVVVIIVVTNNDGTLIIPFITMVLSLILYKIIKLVIIFHKWYVLFVYLSIIYIYLILLTDITIQIIFSDNLWSYNNNTNCTQHCYLSRECMTFLQCLCTNTWCIQII